MAGMTWFWRLVCSPDCSEACQVDCPGCHAMAAEWEAQGRRVMYVQPGQGRFTWSNARHLWSCWSRSVSARALASLHPGRLIGRGPAPVAQTAGCTSADCGCHPAAVQDVTVIKDEVRRYYGAQATSVMAGVQDGCCSPGLPADVSCTT